VNAHDLATRLIDEAEPLQLRQDYAAASYLVEKIQELRKWASGTSRLTFLAPYKGYTQQIDGHLQAAESTAQAMLVKIEQTPQGPSPFRYHQS
jgi:hypothetical protein